MRQTSLLVIASFMVALFLISCSTTTQYDKKTVNLRLLDADFKVLGRTSGKSCTTKYIFNIFGGFDEEYALHRRKFSAKFSEAMYYGIDAYVDIRSLAEDGARYDALSKFPNASYFVSGDRQVEYHKVYPFYREECVILTGDAIEVTGAKHYKDN
jgi:hypothetical protein